MNIPQPTENTINRFEAFYEGYFISYAASTEILTKLHACVH